METKTLETLIKIVKLIDGYEMHFRTANGLKIEFVSRPMNKGGK